MNPFGTLSLPTTLTLTHDQIKDAYNVSEKSEAHLTARNALLNPAERLQQWMTLLGIERKRHAPIPGELIPVFSDISDCVNTVSSLAHKRKGATTTLAQTLLDKQLFEQKDHLQALSEKLSHFKTKALSDLPEIESSHSPEKANNTLQCLKFLQKWEAELNKSFTLLL